MEQHWTEWSVRWRNSLREFLVSLTASNSREGLAELEALTMAYNAIQGGASGVDMGRNVFQSLHPDAMLTAINAVVHAEATPDEAYSLLRSMVSD